MSLSAKIERVVSDLMAYGPEKIILFGSAARGDDDDYSDIDLMFEKL
jgi:predicted nucleotidyltransferase